MKRKINMKDLQSYALIGALIIITLMFTILTKGSFISPRNISNIFIQSAVTAILAVGMTFVIVLSHIDLSAGSLLGLIGGISAILNVWLGWNTWLVIGVSITLGIILGLIQGWFVAYQDLPAFIVTLGGMLIFRGILIGITGGQTISSLDEPFKKITITYLPYSVGYIMCLVGIVSMFYFRLRKDRKRKELGIELEQSFVEYVPYIILSIALLIVTYMLNQYLGVPVTLVIVAIIAGVSHFIFEKTPFGRSLYAIGGNAEAAKLSGLNIRKNTLIVFGIMGALSGLAGVLLTSRLNAATSGAGNGYEMDAIASVVIGGTSLSGGSGNILGSLVGALIMVSINNGMSMMNIPAFWQYIVRGTIVVIAVWIDVKSKNK